MLSPFPNTRFLNDGKSLKSRLIILDSCRGAPAIIRSHLSQKVDPKRAQTSRTEKLWHQLKNYRRNPFSGPPRHVKLSLACRAQATPWRRYKSTSFPGGASLMGGPQSQLGGRSKISHSSNR